MILITKTSDQTRQRGVCVCVCVIFPAFQNQNNLFRFFVFCVFCFCFSVGFFSSGDWGGGTVCVNLQWRIPFSPR